MRARPEGDEDNGVFCVLPWTHVAVRADGRVFPCCDSFGTSPVGDLRREELREVWNGPDMRRLRLNMLAGRKSAACADCYQRERAGLFSPRQAANKDYAAHLPRAAATKPDGSLDSFQLAYLDLRFSNECNFRCRICGPWFSTAWHADSVAAAAWNPDMRGHPAVLRATDDPDGLWRQIEPHLDGLEEVYFAGGEPLIMKEHRRVLDALVERKLFHVRLRYSTNFSVTRAAGGDVMPLWARFRDVLVAASLDAAGARGEYLRKGQVWSQAVENRRRMLEVCPNARFMLSPTLSAHNAWHLPDFHWDWLERGYVEPEGFHLNNLLHPDEYRTQVLPRVLKEDVAARFKSHGERLRRRWGQRGSWAADQFREAIDFMLAQDLSGLLPKFRAQTRGLDGLRGERFEDVFPELAALMAG